MSHAPDRVRGGIAFLLGARYLELGRLDAIRSICALADPEVATGVLGSLTGAPTASAELGPGIVALAIEGASHPASAVRAAACSVLMNQCAWEVDVSEALTPMLHLLDDSDVAVRQGAAYAIGNFARSKRYELTPHITVLARRLKDESVHVCTAAGWALWKLSARRDISAAVPALAKMLESQDEYNGPRKNAAGALLRFARRSPENRAYVERLVAGAQLDSSMKEIARFLRDLSAEPSCTS